MANNEYKIILEGILDRIKTKTNINADIKDLQKQIDQIKIKTELDQTTVKKLAEQVQNAVNQKILLSDININAVKAKQTGQQLGQLISESAEKAITSVSSPVINELFKIDPSTSKEFKNEMSNLVKGWTNSKGKLTDIKIDTKTVYDKDAQANIESLSKATVTYKNELDEIIKKTIAWRQTGTVTNKKGKEKKLFGFVEIASSYNKALESASAATDNFADRQLKLKSALSNTLNSIKSGVSDQNVSKPIKTENNLNEIEKQYKAVEKAIENVGTSSKSNFAAMESDARTQISVLENMIRQYRNAESVATSLRTKDFETVKSIQTEKLNEFENKIKTSRVPVEELESELSSLHSTLSNAFNAEGITSFLNEIDIAKAKFSALQAEFKNKNNFEVAQIRSDGLSKEILKLQADNVGLKDFNAQINSTTVNVKSLLSELAEIKTTGDVSVVKEKWTAFKNAASEAGIVVDKIVHPLSEVDRQTFHNQLQAWKRLNSSAKQFYADIDKIDDKLSEINNTNELSVLRKQFKELDSAASAIGVKGFNHLDKFKNALGKISEWIAPMQLIVQSGQVIRDMASNVGDLDNSLLELSKVSDLSSNGLEKVTEASYELGKTVGKTGTETIDAVTNFKRSGYDISESFTYAEEALKMANISENLKDTGDNAQSLVNIMKGFREETPEFAKHINDAINQVSNTEAVDFDNLVDGSTRLSAVAKQAGMSFEEMLGTLTGTYEILGNMEKAASGQITIFSRLQGMQIEGEEEVSTVAKLQDTFSKATKGVVNIVDQTSGQLRSVYNILDDLSSVWNTLDKNTQEALSFEAAGTRQKSVFLSMMSNWNGVKDAVKSATDSVGSANVENEKYLNSLSGKMEQFESAFEHLSKTVIDSDFLKALVDIGTTGVSAIDSLVKALTPLGTIVAIGGGIFGAKNIGKCA